MEEILLDGSVYPDLDEAPDTLDSDEDKADYVARVCRAWDFGIIPTPATFTLFAGWRAVFDRFPLRHSPAYGTFRLTSGWPVFPIRRPGKRGTAAMAAHCQILAPIPCEPGATEARQARP